MHKSLSAHVNILFMTRGLMAGFWYFLISIKFKLFIRGFEGAYDKFYCEAEELVLRFFKIS